MMLVAVQTSVGWTEGFGVFSGGSDVLQPTFRGGWGVAGAMGLRSWVPGTQGIRSGCWRRGLGAPTGLICPPQEFAAKNLFGQSCQGKPLEELWPLTILGMR